jgi:hypothetical protein
MTGLTGNTGITWLGDWNSGTTYAIGDAVYYDGSAYYSILAGTNQVPSLTPSYWSIIAQKGSAGAQGPTGVTPTLTIGTVTATGPAGTPSVSITGATLSFVLQQGPTGAASTVTGPTGPSGVLTQSTAPGDTAVIWMDTTITGSQMALDDLNDVVVTSASTGQTLIHNGTNFVNTTVPSYNYIINGAFDIWQRGTSFASAVNGAFSADRYIATYNGTGVRTISQESFTLGAAPEAGYEGTYFYRYNQTSAGTGGSVSNVLEQKIEGVRTLANEVITISFWAKADATRTVTPIMTQYFGTGGSPSAYVATSGSAKTLTTSWARYTATVTLPSISGKTVGTAGDDSLILTLQSSTVNATQTIDIWGVQVEEGSVATPFRRNAPSIQAELAACQRYYYRVGQKQLYQAFGSGIEISATQAQMIIPFPVEMRVQPAVSAVVTSLTVYPTVISVTSISTDTNILSSQVGAVYANFASGGTVYRPCMFRANGSLAPYIDFSAEL